MQNRQRNGNLPKTTSYNKIIILMQKPTKRLKTMTKRFDATTKRSKMMNAATA